MAMSFPDAEKEPPLLSTINTTPLVDVMLVLLIIFLITIPAVNSQLPIALPKVSHERQLLATEDIVIGVDKAGQYYWQDERLSGGLPDLQQRLQAVAAQTPQPKVQVQGDAATAYEAIGRVVFLSQSVGIERIGFLTEPVKAAGR